MCHLTGKTEPVAPSEDECKAIVGEPAPDFELESDLGQESRSLFLSEGQYFRLHNAGRQLSSSFR